MITPSLRIKVTDFLATDYEQKVFQELMKIKQLPEFQGVHFPLYFWYDREYEVVDLNVLKDFMDIQMIIFFSLYFQDILSRKIHHWYI